MFEIIFLLQIRIVALRTKPGDGYIAFDDYSIKTDVSREACEILPPGIENVNLGILKSSS